MTTITRGSRGAKYVSGHTDEQGRIVAVRDDGSTDSLPIWIALGSIVDNGDFTCTLTIP